MFQKLIFLLPLYLLTISLSSLGYAQQNRLNFRNIGIDQGLNQPFPYHIIHAKSGYLWIAGENGLWKYDGSIFKQYLHDPNDSTSLVYDFVWTIFEDSDGNIWAGTYGGGLSKYDPVFDCFRNFSFIKNSGNSISDNYVRAIDEDAKGNLWIGTNNGLNKFDPKTGTFEVFLVEDGLKSNVVRIILLSKDKSQLFIGTADGLNFYDFEKETFLDFQPNPSKNNRLSHHFIYEFLEYPEGTLWIGTGKGLNRLDLESNEMTYYFSSSDPSSISNDVVFNILPSPTNKNKLLVGTMNGLNIFDLEEEKFERILSKKHDPKSLRGDNIYALAIGLDSSIWVGVNNEGVFQHHQQFSKFNSLELVMETDDKYYKRVTSILQHNDDEYLFCTYSGLFVKNLRSGKVTQHKIPGDNPTSRNRITNITKISENIYWVSIWGHRIYEWNHATKKFSRLNLKNPEDGYIPAFNLTILHDSKGRVWLGNSERGLFSIDKSSLEIRNFPISENLTTESLHDEFISFIFEDSEQNIWIGTHGGLNKLNQDSTFTKYEKQQNSNEGLSNNKINHISEDDRGHLWISTELGLNKFDRKNGEFTQYFSNNHLPSNTISASLTDDQGTLWVSTSEGIAKMVADGMFQSYDHQDGIQDNYFIFRSAFKDMSGNLFFGSSNGLEYFLPQKIMSNLVPPKVKITGFDLFNRPVGIGDDSGLLQRSIDFSEKVTLHHDQSVISIHFGAINFINGNKNSYKFRLKGYDKDWRPETSERVTTYTSLPHGNYVFEVMAANNEGIWSNEIAKLKIQVLPPWYATWWFKGMTLGLVMFVGVFQINKYRKKKNHLENLVAQRTSEIAWQKEEIEAQHEALQQKNERIESLLKELNHRVKNNLQLVSSILNLQSKTVKDQNAKDALLDGKMRMQALSLLHQKLYMKNDMMDVNCKEYVVELVENIETAFKPETKTFDYELEIGEFELKLEQSIPLGLILNELITNSFKHIHKKEILIQVHIQVMGRLVEFVYSDNGPGISNELIQNSDTFGLTMVQSLVEQLEGNMAIRENGTRKIVIQFKKTD
ncbi:two-component regulator propeller domain-containing protein [Belliella marina]|uniref:Two-component regulator propeller domain-containing protein n=1 Tax=Belliella marina TaxID=1644146 RepID=A0ABW4VRF2_9BACT